MNLSEYMNVAIVVMCLGLGFGIKMWIKDLDNKWIPTICFIAGVVVSFGLSGLSVDSFNVGWISGLASTGMHQLVVQLIDKD